MENTIIITTREGRIVSVPAAYDNVRVVENDIDLPPIYALDNYAEQEIERPEDGGGQACE